jgi:ankyrin repeat protein
MKRRVNILICLAASFCLVSAGALRAQELSAREKSLLEAISKKEGEKALRLLRGNSGLDVNLVDPVGRTLLMNAVTSGLEDLVKELLDRGANINAKSKEGQTALMLAADFGHIELLRLLLSKGADLKLKDQDDWTALQYANMRVQGSSDEKKKTYEEIVRILKEAEKPQAEQASRKPQ